MDRADHALELVAGRLAAAGCVAASTEAEEFLAAAPDAATLERWLHRREQGEPPAWIIGSVAFCGRRLAVDPGVYVPRFQTEELARRAAAALPSCGRALDLCTGAGAIAAHLAAEVADATVVAVDIDERAVRCARRNHLRVIRADLAEPIGGGTTFDVVTAVAPYVPTDELRLLPADVQRFEPRPALDGGDDGLRLVRRVLAAAARLLRPGGWVLIEVGGTQDDGLGPDLDRHGFGTVEPWHDEDGDLRGIAARATLR